MNKQETSWFILILAFMLTLLSVSADHHCENNEPLSCKNHWKNPPLNSEIEVTYEQLKHMMSTGRVQLFDVREPEEVKDGFIPGATNIPLGEVENGFRLPPSQFRERFSVSKPQTSDSDIVFYCQRGLRSLTALETARALGYTRAQHYTGGLTEWIDRERL